LLARVGAGLAGGLLMCLAYYALGIVVSNVSLPLAPNVIVVLLASIFGGFAGLRVFDRVSTKIGFQRLRPA